MYADLNEIKKDLTGQNTKIDNLDSKVVELEKKSEASDLKNENTVKEIKGEMAQMESRVTGKLMSEIEPSLKVMQKEIPDSVGTDLRRLVQEELELQRCREAAKKQDAIEEPIDQVEVSHSKQASPKQDENAKNQKKNKN